ncbi:MAG: tetratricopeptide repeat protein [Cyanobacteria bacterium P01_C01_bin.38]
MKELRNNYWQFVIGNLARFGLSALLGIVLVGESVSAVPKSAGVEIAQQGAIDNKEEIRQRAKQIFAEGMQLSKQGTVESRQQAIKKYEEALTLFQQVDYKLGKALTFSAIASLYDNSGEKLKALDYYNQAITLWQELKNLELQYDNLNAIGDVYSNSGAKQKALDYYKQALTLSQQIPDRQLEAETITGIARIYHDLGENQKALSSFHRVLTLFQQLKNKRWQATILNNIGVVYSNLGEQQKAVDYYNQALTLLKDVEHKSKEAITLHNIAKTQRDKGNLQQALTNSKAAVNIIENLRTKVDSNELRTSYFATVQDIYKLHIDILMQLHKQNPSKGYNAQALAASEKSRARGLLELLTEANADIRKGVNPQLVAQEKRLQQLINSKEKLRLEILSDKNKSDDLISKAAAQRFKKEVQNHINELNQLQTKIKTTSPKYAQLKYPEPLDLAKIQQQLDKNTVLLQYSLGEKRSYLWKVTPDSLDSYELPKSEQIETVAKKLRNLLQDPSIQNRSIEETNKS